MIFCCVSATSVVRAVAASHAAIPAVPRTSKPDVARQPSETTLSPATNPILPGKNLPPKSANATGISTSTAFSDVGRDFQHERLRPPSPKPGLTGKQNGLLPSSSSTIPNHNSTITAPRVRNIPIDVERASVPAAQPSPLPPPQVVRALKPIENLPPKAAQHYLPSVPPEDFFEPSERWVMGGSKPGFTGLMNLGNSCYMSSILQCLAHTKAIREYYKTGRFKEDINFENPKGTKGRISVFMAELMHRLWHGGYRYFAPKFMKYYLAQEKQCGVWEVFAG